MMRWRALAAIAALAPMIGALWAQDEPRKQDPTRPADKQTQQQRMPTFEPSKEHQLLKQFDGEWEFKAKCQAPGMDPMEGQGTETNRYGFGGFWLETEDKGMMDKKDWTGKGLMGWDPQKKK